MRKLSDTFLESLKSGFLAGITLAVIDDFDLNLEIRNNYINLYYKGHSLLKLVESSPARYKVDINIKFIGNLNIPKELVDQETTNQFVKAIPGIKQKIVEHGKGSLEIEYEQMIIRANNYERRNNSEYFIVDRQYTDDLGRFDLTAIYWQAQHRRWNQEVAMCLMEIKCALNPEIASIHSQLERYYEAIKPKAASIASEGESIFRQKLELGLYNQSKERIEAMKTLTFSRDISLFQFILVLVDYNPNSSLLNLENVAKLHFANQIKVFYGGFAMWQQNVKPLGS